MQTAQKSITAFETKTPVKISTLTWGEFIVLIDSLSPKKKERR